MCIYVYYVYTFMCIMYTFLKVGVGALKLATAYLRVCVGSGILSGVSGNAYHGEWKEDRKHGAGVVHYVSGVHERLIGKWVKDEMDGWGTMMNRNGDRLEGSFVNDFLEGQASVFLACGSEFHGSFKQGRINGHGTYTYADGSRYTGMFANDMRHGYGVYVYASGNKFLGAWEADKRCGHGKLEFYNRDIYDGNFEDDCLEGQVYMCPHTTTLYQVYICVLILLPYIRAHIRTTTAPSMWASGKRISNTGKGRWSRQMGRYTTESGFETKKTDSVPTLTPPATVLSVC
jgi:hypothetical protein